MRRLQNCINNKPRVTRKLNDLCFFFTDGVSCRFVLNLMVIIGFMFNYMLRVNLTIAIVEMVLPPNVTTTIENGNTSLVDNGDSYNDLNNTKPLEDFGDRYAWDKYQQNMLLGSFFVGYVLTELPGGRLAEIIGARRVFGYSMGAASFVTLLTPVAADWGFVCVLILRVLLGFFLGATWPAMPPMANKWIPPNDRSKFIANMMASSLGAAITMPVCGFLIHHFGWPSTFYCTGKDIFLFCSFMGYVRFSRSTSVVAMAYDYAFR